MFNWNIVGYIGVFFAMIYRIPQITKIYKMKKGEDVSKKAFLLQNGAYISFILYVIYGKDEIDYIFLVYYIIGLLQNMTILGMKKYYKNTNLQIDNTNVLKITEAYV